MGPVKSGKLFVVNSSSLVMLGEYNRLPLLSFSCPLTSKARDQSLLSFVELRVLSNLLSKKRGLDRNYDIFFK